jgi:hypothetical protein
VFDSKVNPSSLDKQLITFVTHQSSTGEDPELYDNFPDTNILHNTDVYTNVVRSFNEALCFSKTPNETELAIEDAI